jgi:cytochrome c-type biogenesis protein CcmH/NrfG
MKRFTISMASLLFLFSVAVHADEGLLPIQHKWAEINYSDANSEQKVEALLALASDVEARLKAHPQSANDYAWLGIIQSTTAGAEGGIGALKYAKAAKKSFEKAMSIDESALQGSAMVSLGVLYHKVPGWPIGFGSDKKAKALMTQGLALNADGIDPNFFYSEFLFDEGEYKQAMTYLERAEAALPRPDRPLADKGRQAEIQQLKGKLLAKLD